MNVDQTGVAKHVLNRIAFSERGDGLIDAPDIDRVDRQVDELCSKYSIIVNDALNKVEMLIENTRYAELFDEQRDAICARLLSEGQWKEKILQAIRKQIYIDDHADNLLRARSYREYRRYVNGRDVSSTLTNIIISAVQHGGIKSKKNQPKS